MAFQVNGLGDSNQIFSLQPASMDEDLNERVHQAASGLLKLSQGASSKSSPSTPEKGSPSKRSKENSPLERTPSKSRGAGSIGSAVKKSLRFDVFPKETGEVESLIPLEDTLESSPKKSKVSEPAIEPAFQVAPSIILFGSIKKALWSHMPQRLAELLADPAIKDFDHNTWEKILIDTGNCAKESHSHTKGPAMVDMVLAAAPLPVEKKLALVLCGASVEFDEVLIRRLASSKACKSTVIGEAFLMILGRGNRSGASQFASLLGEFIVLAAIQSANKGLFEAFEEIADDGALFKAMKYMVAYFPKYAIRLDRFLQEKGKNWIKDGSDLAAIIDMLICKTVPEQGQFIDYFFPKNSMLRLKQSDINRLIQKIAIGKESDRSTRNFHQYVFDWLIYSKNLTNSFACMQAIMKCISYDYDPMLKTLWKPIEKYVSPSAILSSEWRTIMKSHYDLGSLQYMKLLPFFFRYDPVEDSLGEGDLQGLQYIHYDLAQAWLEALTFAIGNNEGRAGFLLVAPWMADQLDPNTRVEGCKLALSHGKLEIAEELMADAFVSTLSIDQLNGLFLELVKIPDPRASRMRQLVSAASRKKEAEN